MSYRILSLDGGGTWALIQVKALMKLYPPDISGHDVLQDFDLVAATSGGSIVLGALIEGFTLSGILAFFENQARRESVFSPTHSWGDRALHDLTGLGPKYSSHNKLPALQSALPTTGNVALTNVTKGLRRSGSKVDLHVLIVAFDYDRNRATFFRSSTASGVSWGTGDPLEITLAEAIHASTNAPVNYFDAPATFPDRTGSYWDGAITGCNNPILAAVTEAIVKGVAPADIAALSIGTASVALPWPDAVNASSPYVQKLVHPGIVTDLRKLATSILDDPPDAATFLAHVATGGGAGAKAPADSRVVRMNPLISPLKNNAGVWYAPGSMAAAQFNYLTTIGIDAIKQAEVDAISAYADLWVQGAAPNQPIRMNGDTLSRELGQTTFPETCAAWKAIA